MRPDDGGPGRPPLPAEAGPHERTLYDVYDVQTGIVDLTASDWGTSAESVRVLAAEVRGIVSALTGATVPWTGPAADAAYGTLGKLAENLDTHAEEIDRIQAGLTIAHDSVTTARTQYVRTVRTVSLDVDPAGFQKPATAPQGQTATDLPTVLDHAAYDKAVSDARAAREKQAAAVLATFTESMTTATKKLPVEPADSTSVDGGSTPSGGTGGYPSGGGRSPSGGGPVPPAGGDPGGRPHQPLPPHTGGPDDVPADPTPWPPVDPPPPRPPVVDPPPPVLDGPVDGTTTPAGGGGVGPLPGTTGAGGTDGPAGSVGAGGAAMGGVLAGGGAAAVLGRGGMPGGAAAGRLPGSLVGGAGGSAGRAGTGAAGTASGRSSVVAAGGQGGSGRGAGGAGRGGASRTGRYGVPALGERGGGRGAAGGGAAGSRGRKGERDDARDGDFLTREDEEAWFEGAEDATPPVWQ